MFEENNIERVKIFFANFGMTLKKSVVWLVLSYVIPILNVLILLGIHRQEFSVTINVVSIIIATNSCIITSLLHLFYVNSKKRELPYVLGIVTIISSVTLFVLCLIQIEIDYEIMDLSIYEYGSYVTFAVSTFLLLISKYDEVQALSTYRADKGKKTQTTTIDGQNISL